MSHPNSSPNGDGAANGVPEEHDGSDNEVPPTNQRHGAAAPDAAAAATTATATAATATAAAAPRVQSTNTSSNLPEITRQGIQHAVASLNRIHDDYQARQQRLQRERMLARDQYLAAHPRDTFRIDADGNRVPISPPTVESIRQTNDLNELYVTYPYPMNEEEAALQLARAYRLRELNEQFNWPDRWTHPSQIPYRNARPLPRVRITPPLDYSDDNSGDVHSNSRVVDPRLTNGLSIRRTNASNSTVAANRDAMAANARLGINGFAAEEQNDQTDASDSDGVA